MSLKQTLKFVTITALAIGVTVVVNPNVSKVAAETKQPTTPAATSSEPKAASSDPSYSYIAQPGDSYTKMARKAIQTYGKKAKVNISQAGIIFAETNLTIQAGSPILEISQKVEFKESVVKSWVEKALKLSDAEKSAWNYYVQFVNFNTDKIGVK